MPATDPSASEKKLVRNAFREGDCWFNTGDVMSPQGMGHAACGLQRSAVIAAFHRVADAQAPARAIAQRSGELIFQVRRVDHHLPHAIAGQGFKMGLCPGGERRVASVGPHRARRTRRRLPTGIRATTLLPAHPTPELPGVTPVNDCRQGDGSTDDVAPRVHRGSVIRIDRVHVLGEHLEGDPVGVREVGDGPDGGIDGVFSNVALDALIVGAAVTGAHAIGVVSDESKREFVMSMGAKAVLNRKDYNCWGQLPKVGTPEYDVWLKEARNFGKAIWEITGKGVNVDLVFEHPGEATFPVSTLVVKRGGMVVFCAGTTGYNLTMDARYVWMHQKRIQGSHFAHLKQASAANQFVLDRRIYPCMSEVLPWAEIPRAHQMMWKNEHKPGNMAVLVNAPRTGLRTLDDVLEAVGGA